MVVLLVIYVPNIKEVFGLAGASVATMLVIIMPAGFYYLVSSISESHDSCLGVKPTRNPIETGDTTLNFFF